MKQVALKLIVESYIKNNGSADICAFSILDCHNYDDRTIDDDIEKRTMFKNEMKEKFQIIYNDEDDVFFYDSTNPEELNQYQEMQILANKYGYCMFDY